MPIGKRYLAGPRQTLENGLDVKIYSTTWCGYCRRLKRQMEERGIAFTDIDIEEQPELGERIVDATGGYRTVPSVEVGDRLLVNPSIDQVQEAMESRPRV